MKVEPGQGGYYYHILRAYANMQAPTSLPMDMSGVSLKCVYQLLNSVANLFQNRQLDTNKDKGAAYAPSRQAAGPQRPTQSRT